MRHKEALLPRGIVITLLWLSLGLLPAPAQTLGEDRATGPTALAASRACLVTPYSTTRPPDSSMTAFTTTWYSQDRVWIGLDPRHRGEWYAGDVGNRVVWRWFVPGQLGVVGKRLDAPAPPMRAIVLMLYGGPGYETGTLVFPMSGCWEVTGNVAENVLRFVVYVHPTSEHHLSRTPSGVAGQVVIGPQCPVVEVGREDACRDKPYQATLVVKEREGAREITRITTRPDGAFRVALPPGTYVIEPLPGGSFYPYGKPEIVRVEPDKFTFVTIYYDTGLR
jgi:hypothetical protein